jgi:RHS repeat-associated protein
MIPDLLGSTVGLVNSAGAIATGYQYSPFGQTTTSGASSTNPFQDTGREMDPTSLYDLRARYYSPIAQRFISPDPIGLSGGQVNLYAYAFNSPMNLTDLLGLSGGGSPPHNTGFFVSCAIHDPDGNFIEFTQISDDWFRHIEKHRAAGSDVVGRWRASRCAKK